MILLALIVATSLAVPGHAHDGDTFRAEVAIWPGLTASVAVRVLGVDTPELSQPKCDAERAAALKARDFTQAWLQAAGTVYLTGVRADVYTGRVDANVFDPNGASLADALLAAHQAVPMGKKRTQDWCGP